jgi:amidase
MKPTFGLVPCTGNLGMEYSLDHIGPITTFVADNALVLSVIAGSDGLDTRQAGVLVDDYRADLSLGVNGLRIGLLREGFARAQSDSRVDDAVRAAAERLVEAGATLVEVSAPLHADAGAIWLPRAAEGCLATMFTATVSDMAQKACTCRRRCTVNPCGAAKPTCSPTRSSSGCSLENICAEPMV